MDLCLLQIASSILLAILCGSHGALVFGRDLRDLHTNAPEHNYEYITC